MSQMIAATVARRGASFLDDTLGKEWTSKIDTEILDIASSNNCILGQIFGSYHDGIDAIFSQMTRITPIESHPSEYLGFCGDSYFDYTYSELNDAWIKVVEEKQGAIA